MAKFLPSRQMVGHLIAANFLFGNLDECRVYIEILDYENFAELKLAFDMACNELRLGVSAKDLALREHLAKQMLDLAQAGERDPIRIRTQAVDQMRQPK
jgi:hypothetical protein